MREEFPIYAQSVIEKMKNFLPTPPDLVDEKPSIIEKEKQAAAEKIVELEFALFILTKIAKKEQDPLALQYILYNHNMYAREGLENQYKYAIQKLCYWYPHWRFSEILTTAINEYITLCTLFNRTQIKFSQIRNTDDELIRIFEWCQMPLHDMQKHYEILCEQPLLPKKQSLNVVTTSVGLIEDKYQQVHAINIPEYLQCAEEVRQEKLENIGNRELVLEWRQLEETAKEMDKVLPGNEFEKRLKDTAVYDINASKQIIAANKYKIEGTEHWIGPLGVGKSTFTRVVAYYLSKKVSAKKLLTIFVKDVTEVINLTEELIQLGILAEAFISHNERESHVDKYLRYMSSDYSEKSMDYFQSPLAKRLLSICPLLSTYANLKDTKPPCFSIVEKKDKQKEDFKTYQAGKKCVCPYFSKCDYTAMYRNLKKAEVVITTIQSTINTKVPAVFSDENMTFYEFFNIQSHLVLMDESDKHQLTLDDAFMSSEQLFTEDTMYLSILQSQILQNHQLNRLRRGNQPLQMWLSTFDKTAALLRDIADIVDDKMTGQAVRRIVGKERFTSVSVLKTVLLKMYEQAQIAQLNKLDKKQLQESFSPYAERINQFNRLYKEDDYYTGRIQDTFVRDLITIANLDVLSVQLKEAERFFEVHFNQSEQNSERIVLSNALILAIYFAKLEKNLATLSNKFTSIMSHLDEEAKSRFHFFNKKRKYYEGVCPIPYIGVQYGFVLEKNDIKVSFSELLVFDYEAVGRYLLVNYTDLYEGFYHQKGAHAILLSATSLSPYSHKYNIQSPPKRVIKSTREKQPRLKYYFTPQFDKDGYIRISGLFAKRSEQVKRLARAFIQNNFLENTIQNLPESRKRALLVMTSYDASYMLAEALYETSPSIGKEMALLVREKKENTKYTTITREEVPDIAKNYPNVKYLVIPLESIDRGMNILLDNSSGLSAFSSILYCTRPYPTPNDQLNKMRKLNVFTLNQQNKLFKSNQSIKGYFQECRNLNFALLAKSYEVGGYQALDDVERNTLLMDYQVAMFQLEGRLIRGGSDGYIYFIDSAFMPNTVQGKVDNYKTSMIEGWKHLNEQLLATSDRELIEILYGARIEGLKKMEVDILNLNEEYVDEY